MEQNGEHRRDPRPNDQADHPIEALIDLAEARIYLSKALLEDSKALIDRRKARVDSRKARVNGLLKAIQSPVDTAQERFPRLSAHLISFPGIRPPASIHDQMANDKASLV